MGSMNIDGQPISQENIITRNLGHKIESSNLISDLENAPANFVPSQIENLIFWIDATDPNCLQRNFASLNNEIDACADKSPRKFPPIPWFRERPKLVKNAINSNDAIIFNGNSLFRLDRAFIETYPVTIFSVTKGTAAGTKVFFAQCGITNDLARVTLHDGTSNCVANLRLSGGDNTATVNGDPQTTHILTARYISTTDRRLQFNGGVESTSVIDKQMGTHFRTCIGSLFTTSSSGSYRGYVGEIIVYQADLTDSQRLQVENYLRSKWRI